MATARRSSGSSSIRVDGLGDFTRDLRALGPEWPKALRAVHKDIANKGRDWARAKALGMGGVQAKAARAIGGTATAREARVSVSSGARTPYANAAFWGAKRRTGWYAAERYATSAGRQHPPWVGNSWDAAVRGQGPYAINAALADHVDEILDYYSAAIDDLTRRAFPS